ncbi:MAG: HNH endonuclease [Sphaerospermopsis kisseleviana]
MVPAADDLLTERLLRVIDEGRRTATYKLALLLALIDCAAEAPGAIEIPTRSIAEHVIALYYPQTRSYAASGGIERELRQISMKSSPVLRSTLALRRAGDARGCRSIGETRRRLPDDFQRALDAVEDTFVRYPIPLLQVVGSTCLPFLYSADWNEGATLRSLRASGNNRLRLLPGVADRLVVLGPLLRPLIELHWVRDVARWTGIATEDDSLRAHLFGTARTSFPTRLVGALRDVQQGSCFYCGDRLHSRGEVDHVLAWSRWPNDAIENLVIADRCNGAKSDHLVAPAHLERWMERKANAADLNTIAQERRWESEPERSTALVRTTYGHLAAGTPLWVRAKEFVEAPGPLLTIT